MKNIYVNSLVFFLAIACVACFTSCGSDDDNDENPTVNNNGGGTAPDGGRVTINKDIYGYYVYDGFYDIVSRQANELEAARDYTLKTWKEYLDYFWSGGNLIILSSMNIYTGTAFVRVDQQEKDAILYKTESYHPCTLYYYMWNFPATDLGSGTFTANGSTITAQWDDGRTEVYTYSNGKLTGGSNNYTWTKIKSE